MSFLTATALASQPTPVTTRALDTGANSEQVESVPISSGEPSPTNAYTLKVPVIHNEEVLRATGDVEVSANRSYPTTVSVRLALTEGESETSGTAVTPWSSATLAAGSNRLTLPVDGAFRASSALGTRYLQLEVKASSAEAEGGDTLSVASNSGRLGITRYAPTAGPTSLETHEMQPLIGALSEQVTSIPVDSEWRVVLSRQVSELTEEDLVDTVAQLGIEKTAGVPVKLEARVLRTNSSTSPGGTEMAMPGPQTLSANTKFARISTSGQLLASSTPANNYVNLSIRAIPLEGSPGPLTVVAGSGVLDLMRWKHNPGNPESPLREGTLEQFPAPWTGPPAVSSVPFAVEGKAPTVVQSLAIFGLTKGQVIRARSRFNADLSGKEAAPVETAIILANSASATSGEVVTPRSGDTISGGAVRAINKSGTYVVPSTVGEAKYLNLVAYANRAPVESGEALKVENGTASLNYSRSTIRAPFNENFEEGLDAPHRVEFNGTLSTTETQSREGSDSLLVNLQPGDENDHYPFDEEGIRRDEIEPQDDQGGGGLSGENNWHAFSVYFPKDFKVPTIDSTVYFDGKIDEVRIHNQALDSSQIEADQNHEYTKTGANLVAAYSFDQGEGGIAVDDSGEGHSGFIKGASWTEGKYGSALDFSHADEVTIPDAPALDLPQAFTLEAWVLPDEVNSSTGTPIISKIDQPAGEMSGYLLRAAANSAKPSGLVASSGTAKESNGPDALPLGEWSHVALTSDGLTLKLYVNGQLVRETSSTQVNTTSSSLTIGSSNVNTATENTWDIFSYMHASSDSREELGCEENPNGVPVSFSVRYFKAGAHTESGEIETAGEYLEMSFAGGQLSTDCESAVEPTLHYVVAPLERDRWYDFVMRNKWTTKEAEAGGSNSSVWLDGKQIFGSQSTPIRRPTLAWRLSSNGEKKAATKIYSGYGLYRGPSLEDPPSQIYIDSIRTGNSYEQVAPESRYPGPHLEAEKFGASLAGSGLPDLQTNAGTFECSGTSLEGVAPEPTNALALTPAYGECGITVGATHYAVSVATNGCHYTLGVREEVASPYAGSWGVACEEGSEAIEFKITKSAFNCLKLWPQEGHNGVSFFESGDETGRGLDLDAEVEGVEYEWVGVCGSGAHSDGVISGETTLSGEDEDGESIGVWLSGEP